MYGYSKIPKAKLIAAVCKTDKQRTINYYKPPKMAVASLFESTVPDLQESVHQPAKLEQKSCTERIKHK